MMRAISSQSDSCGAMKIIALWAVQPPSVAARGGCLCTVFLLFFRDCSQSNKHRKSTPPHLRIITQGNSSVNSTKVDIAMLAGRAGEKYA